MAVTSPAIAVDAVIPTTQTSHVTTSANTAQGLLPFELLVTEYPRREDEADADKYKNSGTNGWFPRLENYVRSIGDECSLFATKHADASKAYNMYYQLITLSIIIIPLLSGFFTLLPLSEVMLRILTGASQLVLSAIGGLNKTMQFSEQAHIHRKASDKYADLHSSVNEQLLFPYNIRDNGVLFARWGRLQFFKLRALTPFPDRKRHRHRDIENNIPEEEDGNIPPVPEEEEIFDPVTRIDPESGQEQPASLLDDQDTEADRIRRNKNAWYSSQSSSRPVLFKTTHGS